MQRKAVSNSLRHDCLYYTLVHSERVQGLTYPNLFILGTSGKVLAIRAEADAANVQIAILIDSVILESGHVLTSGHVEDLSRAVATSRQILAVATETNATDNAIVVQVVNQLNIQYTLYLRVEDCIPIRTLALLGRRQIIRVPVGKHVTDALGANDRLARRGRARDLRRGAGIRVCSGMGLLGGRGTGDGTTGLSRTGRGSWRGRRTVT